MDASCKIQRSIHVFRLVYKYVSSKEGTYQKFVAWGAPLCVWDLEYTIRKDG